MLPLQHGAFWRSLSLAMLVAVLVGALSPAIWFGNKADALSFIKNADKWVHGITFFVLAVWFSGLVERRRYWLVGAGLIAFGALLEFFQMYVRFRTADHFDIAANTAGIIVGLTVAIAGLGGWGLRAEDWYARRNQH